jgi:hypothetical protein
MWVDRVIARGNVTDLDSSIHEERDLWLRKAAKHWAAKFPEFAHLFTQTATGHYDEATNKIVMPEVCESVHKIPLMALLNTWVFKPCACGIQYRQNKKGIWKCYLYQGEPFFDQPHPVLDNFKINIGMDDFGKIKNGD